MKLTQIQHLTVGGIAERIWDKIDRWSEFFITKKQVSLSEAALLTLALNQAVWTALWNIEYPLLTLSFLGLFVLHFGSLFLSKRYVRIIACVLHSFVWSMLLILSIMVEPRGRVVPIAVALVILSGTLSVKLSRADKR